MWPTLFTIGDAPRDIPVHTWGLMITLAFLAAAAVAQVRASRAGVDGDKLGGLYLVAFVTGLAGARLLHFTMAEPQRFFADPLMFFRFWEGGFAFYGGVLLATLCGTLYALWRGINILKLADLAAPAIMIGLALGRIGCFFAGCCHGKACPLPAGAHDILPRGFSGGALYVSANSPFLLLEYHHSVGTNDVVMYPTQIWASLLALGMFFLLSWRWRHRRYDGQVFAWLMIIYPLIRSSIELFRGDTIRGVGYLGYLSTSQLVSIPVFVAGMLLVLLRRGKGVAVVEAPDRDAQLMDEILSER